MLQQDSALAHRACKMVAFLDRKMPDFMFNVSCQHYVTTSKEYLINCHILLEYFELAFLQPQLVKFCINWSSFE